MEEYTKGEWKQETYGKRCPVKATDIAIMDNQHRVICVVAQELDTLDEDQANARLIAAAPDLYEACKVALTHYNYCAGLCEGKNISINNPGFEFIKKALAKVEEK